MEAYAIHKSAMIAPRKARMTMDLIRGKDIATARNILNNTNTKASRLIIKVQMNQNLLSQNAILIQDKYTKE